MSHENQEYEFAHILRNIEREFQEIHHELREIRRELRPKPLTASAPVVISGANMANNTYVMNVGQSQTGAISPFLADGVTSSGGVVSDVAVTFSDPSATFVLNPDNTLTFTGVAANTAPISGSVTFKVTDTDGVVSAWTDPITVSITGSVVPPAQLTQSAPIVVGIATP
jgi:hypothetical protein